MEFPFGVPTANTARAATHCQAVVAYVTNYLGPTD